MHPRDPIHVSWWNTGLAPGGVSRADDARYATAALVLKRLLQVEEIDLLTFGETMQADIEACQLLAGDIGTPLVLRTPRANQGRASALAILYNPTRLTLVEETLIRDSWGGVAFASGWHLVFETDDGEAVLNVVVVHWPSHMFEEAARKRGWIATSLHRALREQRDVLILGDFNDEPFSHALSDGLVAYRDRELVRRRKDAYYNPFWRLLGEQQHVEHETEGRLPAGTHFYRSGTSTRWFTYDQIVVSSALIGPNAWQLVEGATRIVLHEALLTENGTMRDIFDHLPIATAVTYMRGSIDG